MDGILAKSMDNVCLALEWNLAKYSIYRCHYFGTDMLQWWLAIVIWFPFPWTSVRWWTEMKDERNVERRFATISGSSTLTNTSYFILIRWHPSRLVGGSGGTYRHSLCHLSDAPERILPRAMTANSLFSNCTTLPRAKYSMVSVSAAFVLFIVILLPFDTYAETEMLSPGTYPPRSSVTLHLTRPPPTQAIPNRCSMSHLNGCCANK